MTTVLANAYKMKPQIVPVIVLKLHNPFIKQNLYSLTQECRNAEEVYLKAIISPKGKTYLYE